MAKKYRNVMDLVRAGFSDDDFEAPLGEPTASYRGSQERVEVYAARIEAGEELFHPDDKDNWEDAPDRLDSIGPRRIGRIW